MAKKYSARRGIPGRNIRGNSDNNAKNKNLARLSASYKTAMTLTGILNAGIGSHPYR